MDLRIQGDVSEPRSVQGQTQLSVILDEIENSDGWTLSLLIATNAALVKALRRAVEISKGCVFSSSETVEIAAARAADIEKTITAILSQGSDTKEKNLGQPRDERTNDRSQTDGA